MEKGYFTLSTPLAIANKHVLLVDDLITTGATLEAYAEMLNTGKPFQISLATMGITV